eukprot:g28622.t1
MRSHLLSAALLWASLRTLCFFTAERPRVATARGTRTWRTAAAAAPPRPTPKAPVYYRALTKINVRVSPEVKSLRSGKSLEQGQQFQVSDSIVADGQTFLKLGTCLTDRSHVFLEGNWAWTEIEEPIDCAKLANGDGWVFSKGIAGKWVGQTIAEPLTAAELGADSNEVIKALKRAFREPLKEHRPRARALSERPRKELDRDPAFYAYIAAILGVAILLFRMRGAALAATADWLLSETKAEPPEASQFSLASLREAERLFTAAVNWPVWRMLNRAGERLLWQFSIDCPLSPGPSRWRRGKESNTGVPSSPLVRFCAACPCPTQAEWSSEARYVREHLGDQICRFRRPGLRSGPDRKDTDSEEIPDVKEIVEEVDEVIEEVGPVQEEEIDHFAELEAAERKRALARAKKKLSSALHEGPLGRRSEENPTREPIAVEPLRSLLNLSAAQPDAENFARAVSAAQRGKITFDEQAFAALIGQLLATEAAHALVRCALNFGVPEDGDVIPLIPLDIREYEQQDVFRAATSADDSGELDMDLAEGPSVPAMLEFSGCTRKPELNGLYQRHRGRKDLLGHWVARIPRDRRNRDMDEWLGWTAEFVLIMDLAGYLASEIGGGGYTVARCGSDEDLPPEQGWSFSSHGNWIPDTSGFLVPSSRAKRMQALNLTEEEAQNALEGVDLEALRGSVKGRDPEVTKYFCHFFVLLCLDP